jgi:AcrR family transcriptional regulator
MNKILSKRESNKILRRNVIIDAAQKVFFSKGIHTATMDDVTSEANYSKATVYAYFKSKDELFYAISKRGNAVLQKMLSNAAKDQQTGVNKVRAIGFAFFEFAEKYPDYFRFISYFVSKTDFNLDETSEKEMLSLDQILIDSLQLGMNDGSIKKGVNAAVVAKCFWSMATGILQLVTQRGELLDKYLKIQKQEIVHTFFILLEESLATKSILSNK